MRAALYLRVSTVRQAEKEQSSPDQRRQAEDYCAAKGWTVDAEFEERGASATDDKRPIFQEMIDAACRPERGFDVVVVHSFSRFFRDAFLFELYLRRLAKHGVHVASITQETGDDPTSQLARKIVSLFDEFQSQENGKHTLRAMKENARQGFWNGSLPPFGYRTVEAERRGDKIKRRLEIDPIEAEIVKKIFRLHLDGEGHGVMGVKAIADHLNKRGVTYRDGRKFSTGLVHRLLTRQSSTGRHWFNQWTVKTRQLKPREEWIEVRSPAIIDEETFQRVQTSLAGRSPRKIAPRIVNSQVLLTGLAQCATCRGGMQLRTGKNGRYRYYTCSTCTRLGKSACTGRSIRMDLLDGLVLDHLGHRLFIPERMRELLAEHSTRSQDGAAEWAQKAKEAERELRDIDSGLSNLYGMVQRGVAPLEDTLNKHLSGLRQRRGEVLRLKARAERQKRMPRHLVEPERIEQFCTAMRDQLIHSDIAIRKAYLRLFVERIEVDDEEVRMFGHKAVLEAGLRQNCEAPTGEVPGFVQEWRPLRDSNPCYRRERAVS